MLPIRGMPLGVIDSLLVYHDGESNLYGVAVDLRRRLVTGTPAPLLEGVAAAAIRVQDNSALSPSGSLVYVPDARGALHELVIVGRDGTETALSPIRRRFRSARYSPDGRRIAVTAIAETGLEVWIHDIASGTLQPFAREGGPDRPEWSPDGAHLLFRAATEGGSAVLRRRVDHPGETETIERNATFGTLTPDGRHLLFRRGESGPGSSNVWARPMAGDTTSFAIAVAEDHQYENPVPSPDGRWLAVASDVTGDWRIHVQPFPGPGPRHTVSEGGIRHAAWHPDGSRLYYLRGGEMIEARLTFAPAFSVERRVLFRIAGVAEPGFIRTWDIARDGSHFLFVRPVGGVQSVRPVVIHNWATLVREQFSPRQGPR
jgi:eukaryotic-like serine/threonine-protein kinase